MPLFIKINIMYFVFLITLESLYIDDLYQSIVYASAQSFINGMRVYYESYLYAALTIFTYLMFTCCMQQGAGARCLGDRGLSQLSG